MKLKNTYDLNHSQEPNIVLKSYLQLRFRLEIIIVRITTIKRSFRLHEYDTIGRVYAHYGLWNLDLSTHTYLDPWRVHFETAHLYLLFVVFAIVEKLLCLLSRRRSTAGYDSSQPGFFISN